MTKNRWIGTDRIFYCQSRGLCSLNVVAEYNRQKNLIYTWKLPNGDKFIGKNPTSFKLGYGRYIIELTVRDEITGEEKRDILIIQHHPIPKTAKKTSSAREKYILDFKDATKDIGGGVLPENTFSLSQSLLALFVL